MSRNSQERFNAPIPHQNQTQKPNVGGFAGFDFVSPTEFVELPTKGRFYPFGHPLKDKETVEVRHMTTKDEDILNNKNYIKNGVMIDKLLSSVLVDKTIDPKLLSGVDKSYIVVACRLMSYGPEYNVKITCPSCGKISNTKLSLNCEIVEKELPENIEVVNEYVQVTLPVSKAKVSLKILTSDDEDALEKHSKALASKNIPESPITSRMAKFIDSFEYKGIEYSNKADISKMIETLHPMDSLEIRTAYDVGFPSIQVKDLFSCSSCPFVEEVDVPLGTDLFWPKR
jgi:hypothetical protein